MDVTSIIRVFSAGDIRNVRRDSMLRWMPVLPIILALGLRLVFRLVLEQLGRMLDLDLVQYLPTIASAVLLLITPIMYGMMVGFLFLDQRDDGTLTALRVTPVSLDSYMAYRLSVPMLLGVVMTLVAFAIAGVSTVDPLALVIGTLSATPLAPLVALALAAFAQNKVQGFALQKAGSIFLLPPLVAYFLPAAWQPLFWLLPTYWPLKVYWALEAGDTLWWAYALAGVLYSTLLLWLLIRRFHRVVSR